MIKPKVLYYNEQRWKDELIDRTLKSNFAKHSVVSILQKWAFTVSLFYIIANLTFLVLESGQLNWLFFTFFIFYVLNNYLRYILYAAALIIVWNTAHIYVIYLSQKKALKTKTNKNKNKTIKKKHVYSLSIFRTVIQMLHFCIRMCRWETKWRNSFEIIRKETQRCGQRGWAKDKIMDNIIFSQKPFLAMQLHSQISECY